MLPGFEPPDETADRIIRKPSNRFPGTSSKTCEEHRRSRRGGKSYPGFEQSLTMQNQMSWTISAHPGQLATREITNTPATRYYLASPTRLSIDGCRAETVAGGSGGIRTVQVTSATVLYSELQQGLCRDSARQMRRNLSRCATFLTG